MVKNIAAIVKDVQPRHYQEFRSGGLLPSTISTRAQAAVKTCRNNNLVVEKNFAPRHTSDPRNKPAHKQWHDEEKFQEYLKYKTVTRDMQKRKKSIKLKKKYQTPVDLNSADYKLALQWFIENPEEQLQRPYSYSKMKKELKIFGGVKAEAIRGRLNKHVFPNIHKFDLSSQELQQILNLLEKTKKKK